MTTEKILEVLKIYEHKLRSARVSISQKQRDQISHLTQMIPQIRGFINENRIEKAFRWLGFMQGAFWVLDIYTIEEMMQHNKPESEEFNRDA